MNRATPWSIQSVHPDMRDAARDAALREGVTLHQWLHRTIAAHAAENGVDPNIMNHDERAAAIMERLSREPESETPRLFAVDHAKKRTAPGPGQHPANKVDDMLKDLATRLGDGARARTSEPTQSTPWTQASAQQRHEQQSALQNALKEALRVAHREPEPAPPQQQPRQAPPPSPPLTARSQAMAESAALRQQIDQLARNVADQTPRPSAMAQGPQRGQTQDRDSHRRDAIHLGATPPLPPRDTAADDRALRKLTAKTDEIRDLIASVIARPTQTNRIERQLDVLGARIDELAASAPTMAECNELSRGLGEIRNLLHHGMNPGLLDTLDRKIDLLSRRLDAMDGEPKDSLKFDDIARRIDNVHRKIEATAAHPQKADTSTLERMLQDLSRKLDQPAPKLEIPAPDFAPVESEIRRLSNKIDAAAARTDSPGLEGVRRDIASLSARVDAVSVTMESTAAIATRASTESLDALRKELAGLCGRMDRIAASAPEVAVLEGLQSQIEILVDRIEALPRREPPGVHALEVQIIKLAGKIDAIAAPSREETMLAQLQAEIARLSRQFGATPAQSAGPALAMLEQVQAHLEQLPVHQRMAGAPETPLDHSISEMFQQIQTLREASVDAAEATERRAEREVIEDKAQALATAPGASEALQRELSELRAQQDTADRRTTETLNAVHQTLELLVGRLSDLETDISEVRPEPVVMAPPQTEARREPTPTISQEHLPEPPSLAPRVEVRAEPPKEPAAPRIRETGPGAVLSNQASFIAAARRASHAASAEPQPAAGKPTTIARIGELLTQISARATEVRAEPIDAPAKVQNPKADKPGPLAAISQAIRARRRPILIALAGLAVILGSLETLRFLRNGEITPTVVFEITPPKAAQPQVAQVPTPNVAPEPAPSATAAPETALAAPPKVVAPGFSPPLAANGFDAAPTSSLPVAPTAPQQGPRLADAAANGQANAQYEMGVRLAEGRGVTQDNASARQWLEKAADQNLAPAQYRLAAMLERGIGGGKDLRRAQEFYSKAAAQGHVRAMHNMGVVSAEGAEGKPDYASAASWFRKAADFGLRDSQYNLAVLYARGMGVDKNLPVSFAWFTAAAAQGDADSAQKRDEIGARLTPNQMAAAKAMVEAYSPRTPDMAANDVAAPSGGWDAVSVANMPKPAAPMPAPTPAKKTVAPKAKVSEL